MGKWRYAGVDLCDANNGRGVGVTLFVQGCPHHCPGCHNPETWDFDGGHIYDDQIDNQLFQQLSKPYIKRLTLSGGEPFSNVHMCDSIASRFKQLYPQKKLWVYTGYEFEVLIEACKNAREYNTLMLGDIIRMSDVIVDGQYVDTLRDISLPFCGSSNQRIIDVQKSLEANSVVLYDLKQ